jgi:hypothetical protein
LGAALLESCDRLGVFRLREITLVAIEPRLSFGFGEKLDPLSRLEEYSAASVKQHGNELQCFGKWVGKALDAPNYPLFELIGLTHGAALLRLSRQVVKTVFKPRHGMRLFARIKSAFSGRRLSGRKTHRGVPFTVEELGFVDETGEIVGCSYEYAAATLIRTFAGGVIPKDLASLLDDYTKEPCLETALDLILFDAKFLGFFVNNKRDKEFREPSRAGR